MREKVREREREHHRLCRLLCLSGKFLQKAAAEIAAENELNAVSLFKHHVSLPEAVYFKAFLKFCEQTGVFPVAA